MKEPVYYRIFRKHNYFVVINEDTYGSDALLIKTALHVPVDGNGSRQRYIK